MGKTKSYIITIDEPCHESWDEMTPRGCGRFCHSCQKTVINLVDLPDNQLLGIIKDNPGGFCGRVNVDKIDRPLSPAVKIKARGSYFPGIAASLFTTVSLLSVLRSTAQTPKKEIVIYQKSLSQADKLAQPAGKEKSHKVFGHIIDTTNGQKGIAGKRVRINADNELVAVTDRWGYYEIEIPQRYKGQVFGIAVDCSEEYFGEPVPVRFGELPFKYNFYRGMISEHTDLMGRVAIVHVKKTSWWKRIFKNRK